ncbi:MAG: DHH family phosphoesterase [Lachnospiraceae bacterium]|nr:DHH family phosphoesterase [Lachnospiraceae bacterium]
MKAPIKLKGKLKTYMQWPIYFGVLFLVMTIAMYFIALKPAMIMTAFMVVYAVIVIVLMVHINPMILESLIDFSIGYSQVQKQILSELTIPYALLDRNGNVLWGNTRFNDLCLKDKIKDKHISELFVGIDTEDMPIDNEMTQVEIKYGERDFRIELKRVDINSLINHNDLFESTEQDQMLVALYMFDETDINRYIQEIHDEGFVTALIYIDNYEEALESIDEVRRSVLVSLVDRRVNKCISSGEGIVKKLEKDKYLAVFRYKYLEQLQQERFSVLDEVKSISIGNDMSVTISVGVGANGGSYAKNYELSRAAIELALGRGGDQVVVRDRDTINYFGGKSQQVEKNTRVKARVKAQSLKEIMDSSDKVLVMGHKIGDVDSFGSAVGICRAAKALNKKAHIVINEITTSVRPVLEQFINNPDYDKDMLLTCEEAQNAVDVNTVLVVVDVNKPSITECPELLQMCSKVVVLDHHRQGSDTIDNAELSYIEPFASSACEMVAEILQYIQEGIKLKPLEADALYAGIVIDTNNFINKAGVRTFEAAAYLRRNGADITRVRKLLRNDMSEYKARAEAVRRAEVYKTHFAISSCPSAGLESPTIVGAQAANELLDISNIKASFVLTEYNGVIYISARSIDDVNVQLVMEKLGGGGHMNIAGAQLKECDMEQAVAIIRETIDSMLENNEI